MRAFPCCCVVPLAVLCLLPAASFAQPTVEQVLNDAWVATDHDLFQIDYRETPSELVLKASGAAGRFSAAAFEFPDIGTGGNAGRNLIAVDGTAILRFRDGTDAEPPTLLLDAGGGAPSLTSVTSIAVTHTGTLLFSGYSRQRRRSELWELDLPSTGEPTPSPQLRAAGGPQITDAVFVGAEDVVDGSLLAGGGLIAVAGREVLFFRAVDGYQTFLTLFDARSLPIKNNTRLLSVDLIRRTDRLLIATSERELLTVEPVPAVTARFALIPNIPGRDCARMREQRLVVRMARNAASIVSDLCGQVLRYDILDPLSEGNLPADVVVHEDGFGALAVGEGSEILCVANQVCELAEGFDAEIESESDTRLLVLQFGNLCDRRVAGAVCNVGEVLPGNVLSFNSLLPQAVQDALDATITIPPYMFGAYENGRFGALLVQSDALGAARVSATLEIAELLGLGFPELGVREDFPRPTRVLDLLNQDVAAYAPDNPDLPTVRGFEATPVTTGEGSLRINTRGFSVVMYGLQHDLNAAGGRRPTGGLPALGDGSAPGIDPDTGLSNGRCELRLGGLAFVPQDGAERYFVNLAACLFADQEVLLRSTVLIPNAAFVMSNDRGLLIARLENTKDKLIKALNAGGPSTGSENLQSVLAQLDNYDSALEATAFRPEYVVYKYELQVRSEVLRFNLLARTAPSLPAGGF